MENNQTFLQKNKKLIIVFGFILVVFIFVIYFLFFNKKNISENQSSANLESKAGFNFQDLFNKIGDVVDFGNSDSTQDVVEEYALISNLSKIWKEPVAGYGFSYNKVKYKSYEYLDADMEERIETEKEGTTTKILFLDSKTGFIYEKDLSYPTTSPTQITSSSFQNVVRAYFMNDKNGITSRVVMQYESEEGVIKTVSARIPDYFGSPSKLIDITNLPDNIIAINTSPDTKKMLYVVKKNKTTNGKSDHYTDWYLVNSDEEVFGKKIYTSEIASWRVSIKNNAEIYALRSPTSFETNTLYKMKKNFSGLEDIYEGKTGTNILIGETNNIVSIFTGSGLRTFSVRDTSRGFEDENLSSLNIKTLSEKCALSKTMTICGAPEEIKNYDSGLPDAWYQGLTSWRDDLYLINNDYPFGQLLFDFKTDGEVYDIIDAKSLKIDDLENHLILINKNDGSLWSLNIGNILNNQDYEE